MWSASNFRRFKWAIFSEVTKIFPMLAYLLQILLVNPHNFSAKHVHLQLAQSPMFDEHCYQYPQSTCISSKYLPQAVSSYTYWEFCFPQGVAVSRQIGATTYVETSSKSCPKAIQDAFEVSALAALGKLNKSLSSSQKFGSHRYNGTWHRAKVDLNFRDRSKNCVVMWKRNFSRYVKFCIHFKAAKNEVVLSQYLAQSNQVRKSSCRGLILGK